MKFSLRFCTERDERLIASISSSAKTVTNRNPGRIQKMMIVSTHKSRSRARCRSEILTSLLSLGDTDNGIQDPPINDSHQEIQDLCLDRSGVNS